MFSGLTLYQKRLVAVLLSHSLGDLKLASLVQKWGKARDSKSWTGVKDWDRSEREGIVGVGGTTDGERKKGVRRWESGKRGLSTGSSVTKISLRRRKTAKKI